MIVEKSQKVPKSPIEYICEHCDYITHRKKDFNKHLLTRKHTMIVNDSKNDSEKVPKNAKSYKCECGKEYKYDSGYYRHKKTCTYVLESESEPKINEKQEDTSKSENNDMMKVMSMSICKILEKQEKQDDFNETMVDKLTEVSKQNCIINNYNTTNTTNNFNLNMFLNDTCKNAMNITDFLESIKYSIEDLDYMGKAGYIEGVSRLIIDGLNQLDVTERPIHCTDAKRNSLYLKNNDEWNKETPDMPNIKNVIKKVAKKNIQKLPEWQERNPSHSLLSSHKHKEYINIVNKAMGGSTDEEDNSNYKSIINKVSTATAIDKQAIIEGEICK